MTYTAGTDRGRVREILGDTVQEIFADAVIDDALTQKGSVNKAAAHLLMRLHNDPDMIIRKYSRGGRLDQDAILRIQSNLMQQISFLVDGKGEDASTDLEWEPEADETEVSRQTDENAWRKRTTIDDMLTDIEER